MLEECFTINGIDYYMTEDMYKKFSRDNVFTGITYYVDRAKAVFRLYTEGKMYYSQEIPFCYVSTKYNSLDEVKKINRRVITNLEWHDTGILKGDSNG